MFFNKFDIFYETISPEGQAESCLLDYDQRRDIHLIGPETLIGQGDGTDGDLLESYLPLMSADIKTIVLDDDGRLLTATTRRPPLDKNPFTGHGPFLATIRRPRVAISPFCDWPTVYHSQLTELDRLEGGVDLVSHLGFPGRRFVYKYGLTDKCMEWLWDELTVLTQIPSHPNILPLHRVVVTDAEERVLGMTTEYVEGSDLMHNRERPFKLKWLQQLTDTLDFLHLEVGIVQGDVQLKNLLVDSKTDRLVLFDFGQSRPATDGSIQHELDEVNWVIYDIVTEDRTLFVRQFLEQSWEGLKHINEMTEWPAKGKLDCDQAALREHFRAWAKRRKELGTLEPKSLISFGKGGPRRLCTPEPREEWDDSWDGVNGIPPFREFVPPPHAIDWQRPPYHEAYPGRVQEDATRGIPAGIDCKDDGDDELADSHTPTLLKNAPTSIIGPISNRSKNDIVEIPHDPELQYSETIAQMRETDHESNNVSSVAVAKASGRPDSTRSTGHDTHPATGSQAALFSSSSPVGALFEKASGSERSQGLNQTVQHSRDQSSHPKDDATIIGPKPSSDESTNTSSLLNKNVAEAPLDGDASEVLDSNTTKPALAPSGHHSPLLDNTQSTRRDGDDADHKDPHEDQRVHLESIAETTSASNTSKMSDTSTSASEKPPVKKARKPLPSPPIPSSTPISRTKAPETQSSRNKPSRRKPAELGLQLEADDTNHFKKSKITQTLPRAKEKVSSAIPSHTTDQHKRGREDENQLGFDDNETRPLKQSKICKVDPKPPKTKPALKTKGRLLKTSEPRVQERPSKSTSSHTTTQSAVEYSSSGEE
ncbi:hypothetical protein TruAng_006812 [Truncatella angustata]|nr:hypothetical protein TruAng_006812 [Truncatella angustata]